MVSVIKWPTIGKRLNEVQWELVHNSKTGGVSTNSTSQNIVRAGGMWVGKISFILSTREEGVAWRLFRQKMRSAVNAAYYDMVDPFFCGNLGIVAGVQTYDLGVPHSDGTKFSDGVGYKAPPYSILNSSFSAKGSIFLTTDLITADIHSLFGRYIEVSGWLHQVCEVTEVLNNSGVLVQYKIEITPPLRANLLNGAEIRLEPKVLVKFLEESSGEYVQRVNLYQKISVVMYEEVNRGGLN